MVTSLAACTTAAQSPQPHEPCGQEGLALCWISINYKPSQIINLPEIIKQPTAHLNFDHNMKNSKRYNNK